MKWLLMEQGALGGASPIRTRWPMIGQVKAHGRGRMPIEGQAHERARWPMIRQGKAHKKGKGPSEGASPIRGKVAHERAREGP